MHSGSLLLVCFLSFCSLLAGQTSGVPGPDESRRVQKPATIQKAKIHRDSNSTQAQSPTSANVGGIANPCPQSNPPPALDVKSQPEKTPFSELTLYFFASGFALFVALLGWSDAIRGIDRDTKELERRFLEGTGVSKQDFNCVVKTSTPDQQLDALTRVMTSGKFKSGATVELLGTFKTWNREWLNLEGLTSWKYNLTVLLTLSLFVVGIVSLFCTPAQDLSFYYFSLRTELLLSVLPLVLVFMLMGIIIYSGRRERSLRELLKSIEDKV